ncbi:MAG: hypothetical protein ABIT08_13605 [Bacteroidia bacterium]
MTNKKLQCKIFSGSEIAEVEKKINLFIREYPNMIVDSIHQSADNQILYITFFYHPQNRRAKLKEAAMQEIKSAYKTAFAG